MNNHDWLYYTDYPWIYKTFSFIARNGEKGVNFFFVLSGFLINYLILTEIKALSNFNYKNFIIRRILRIWPLFFLVTAIGFLIKGNWNNILFYLSFLNNTLAITDQSSLNFALFPLWSIAVEEQFYLIIPFLLFLFGLNNHRHFFLFYLVLILISLIYQFNNYSHREIIHYSSLACTTDISIGALGAILLSGNLNIRKIIQQIPKWLNVVVYIVGFLYIILSVYVDKTVFVSFERFIFSVFFLFIILDQAFCKKWYHDSKLFQFLNVSGEYTYGYYMFHMIVLFTVHRCWQLFNLPDNVFIDIILKLIISIVLTYFIAKYSYRFFELPFLKFKNKFY